MSALNSPEAALAFPYNPPQKARFYQLTNEAVIGDVSEVADQLRRMAADFDIDEVVVLSWTHDPDERRRSYELLAKEFDLNAG